MNNIRIKISVITVVFNDSKNIEKTILSILNQSYNNIEYIIIDGGSSDGTVEIISKYSDRLAYFISEKDKGIFNAMNKGWKQASGDFCLFLNSGDYIFNNDVFEKVSKNICLTDAQILYGNLFAFDEKQNWVSKFNEPISLYYFSYSFIPHPSSFISRLFLQKVNGFNERYNIISDWLFFIEAFLAKAKFCYVDITITSFYMKGLSSISDKNGLEYINIFENELHHLKNDFAHFKRLKNFDTSRITKFALSISKVKQKYYK